MSAREQRASTRELEVERARERVRAEVFAMAHGEVAAQLVDGDQHDEPGRRTFARRGALDPRADGPTCEQEQRDRQEGRLRDADETQGPHSSHASPTSRPTARISARALLRVTTPGRMR